MGAQMSFSNHFRVVGHWCGRWAFFDTRLVFNHAFSLCLFILLEILWSSVIPGWTRHAELVFAWAPTGISASVQVALWNRTLKPWGLELASLGLRQVPGCKVDDVSFGGDKGAFALLPFLLQWRTVYSGSYGQQLFQIWGCVGFPAGLWVEASLW